MTLAPGARLGPYEILARLGAGAMGEVYRARDSRLGREVALKILPTEFAESSERRRRFEQESRAAGALNHPNIVTVFEAGTEGGVAFIATELVDGESLRDVITRGALPLRRALELAAQIADGLAVAHAAGIIHRDIKPENVMLTRDGRPKILDFGLARVQAASAAEATMTLTQPGAVMGTAGYMSPEQVTGSPADARSDIFSLGAMLFEMLGGKLPFERATTVETMSAILRDEPAQLPATVPPALEQIVQHCLEKEPARRYQSAQDLAFSLRAYAGTHTSTIGQAAVAAPKARRRWTLVWIAGFAAIAALVAGIFVWLRPKPRDLASYRFSPLAVEAQRQSGAAWSPDGKSVAYIRHTNFGEDEIVVRSMNSLVPARVAKVSGPNTLMWSADSARLYFLNEDGAASVSRAGGRVEQLLKGAYGAASLSPDGKAMILWLVAAEGGGKAAKLWISSPPGAPVRKYEPVPFEYEGSYSPVTLRFAPDGRQILLAVPSGFGFRLWLLPFPGGAKPRQLLERQLAGAGSVTMSWMPDSRHFVIAFSNREYAQSQLWLGDINKNTLTALTAGEHSRYNPAVTPDGKGVAFDSRTADFDVIELPVAGGPVKTLVATSRNETFPAWSSNGQLAYATDRSGKAEIWLKSFQEGWERPVVTESDFAGDPSTSYSHLAFSPDGSRLAYIRTGTKEAGKIWISPAGGGVPVRLTNGPGYEFEPAWSPDGEWIAYFSTDTGLMKIRVGSSEPPVRLEHGHCLNAPQWSPDGKWIACAGPKQIELLSPDGKQKRVVGNGQPYVTWSRDGKDLYALGRDTEGHWRLSAVDVNSGVSKPVADYGMEWLLSSPVSPGFALSLSPDGKGLATMNLNYRSDIWLMEGFQ